jgi:hypothetical protein
MAEPKGPAAEVPTLIASKPGIQRDNTRLSQLAHTDGEHIRFPDGPPIKMAGRRAITRAMGGISRGLHLGATGGLNYVHSGAADRVELIRLGNDGTIIAPADRTPVGLVSNDDYIWTFESQYDQIDGSWKLIAHAAANGRNIDNAAALPAYIGDLDDTAVLTAITDSECSGGICCLHPFMFYFGSAGQIFWSVSNKPADFSTSGTGINIPAGEARPTGAKIIAGRATLGSGVPGGLFWSTNRLLRASYVGGQTTWDFDELATVEILSGRSIVEYNGVYFWIGAGRFMMFDGRVKDVPNTFNKKWFFKRNLNRQYAAKIFGYTVPEHGEIHWSFPKGSSTECNHELVYHVPSGNWWDTPLPLRSAALSPSSTYPYPLLGGVEEESNQYRLWQHETGTDEIDVGTLPRAIRSYFTTSDITFLRGQQPSNASVEVLAIEPDFVQAGAMTVTVLGNSNSRAPVEISDPKEISEPGDGVDSAEQIIDIKEEHRQMRFRFESNTLGGDFEAGQTYASIRPTSTRLTS